MGVISPLESRCQVIGRNKRRSKITRPNDGIGKDFLFAFRADKELSRLLKNVDNKSETITEALREHFSKFEYVTCSHCKGIGKVKKLRGKHK